MLCECGAPARGRVCQRGHRLELREDWEDWDEARRAKIATTDYPKLAVDAKVTLGGKKVRIARLLGGDRYAVRWEGVPLRTEHHISEFDEHAPNVGFAPKREVREAWSPQARAAALAARERNKPAGSFNVGDRVVHDAGGNTGVIAKKTKDAVHVAPDHPESVNWNAIEHGMAGGKRTLLYGHDAPMGGFKPRPPQELQQRGR